MATRGSSDRAIAPERLTLIREAEQRNAARALGIGHVEFLGYEDGEVEDTRQLRLDVARQIRRWQPGLIITQHPTRTYGNFSRVAPGPPGHGRRRQRFAALGTGKGHAYAEGFDHVVLPG